MKFLEIENKTVNWKYILIVFGFAALALVFIYTSYTQLSNLSFREALIPVKQNKQKEVIPEKTSKVLEVYAPAEDQIITEDVYEGFSIEISGKSDFLKSSTKAVIKDSDNNILAKETLAPLLSLLAKDSFSKKVQLKEPSTSKGVVRIYEETSEGEILKEISISVTFEYLERTPPEFREDRIISILLERGMVFYLKNGDIWKANVSDKDSIKKEVFLDKEEDILMFALSPDGKHLAYTVDRLEGGKQRSSRMSGDTVVLYDINIRKETVVFESQGQEYVPIGDLLFTPNSKELYFSNNDIWKVGTAAGTFNKLEIAGIPYLGQKGIFCFLEEFSLDQKWLLVAAGVWEMGGLTQYVIDLSNQKIEKEFRISDSPGAENTMSIEGFINKDILLVSYIGGSSIGALSEQTGIYQLENDERRELHKGLAGRILSKGGELIYSRFSQESNRREFFKIDQEDLELLPLKETKRIIVGNDYHPEDLYLAGNALWLTDTNFSESVLIDQDLDSFPEGQKSFTDW